MKNILKVIQASVATDSAILIARIGIASLMLTHGLPKLLTLFSGLPVQFPPVFGMSAEFSLALAVAAEVLCSILILIGFGTRLAVISLAITMLVAAFLIHGNDPLAVKEPALHYLLVYTVLFLTGSGKYSVDYRLQSRAETARSNERIESPVVAA